MFKKFALLTAGAVILAACGGAAATTTTAATGHDDEATQTESSHDEAFDRQVEITMTEFAFTPDTVTVKAGETIRFVVTNDGQIEHEFRPTTVAGADEHLASGHTDHEEEGAEGEAHEEGEILVQPGETKTLDVHFDEAGEYTIYACLLPGHYESGMVGEFIEG